MISLEIEGTEECRINDNTMTQGTTAQKAGRFPHMQVDGGSVPETSSDPAQKTANTPELAAQFIVIKKGQGIQRLVPSSRS
ncbi:hypothetical protein HHA01_19390 [Halomonas halmophila]|uniref:Uncharacterized protein n=1 Tax=Halomonas halmophila TaxID=252 RepID=A0A4Y4EYD0_9GAMM|nr:hypothetical protein HHA01_19390 [Halomonas halmophila]